MTTRSITHGRTLTALVIISALSLAAAFTAGPATAQTASNVVCNGCVGSKDIKNNTVRSADIKNGQVKKADLANNAVTGAKIKDGTVGNADLADNAVTSGKIADGAVGNADLADNAVTSGKIADGAVGFGKLTSSMQLRITDLEAAGPAPVTTFAVGLDLDGAEATLATNGPLEFFLRCRVNDATNDRIQLVATSTQAGWFKSADSTARVAGEEVMLISFSVATGSVNFAAIGGFAISAADGSTLSLPFTSRGFNTFGHVCTMSGTAVAVGPIP